MLECEEYKCWVSNPFKPIHYNSKRMIYIPNIRNVTENITDIKE